VENLKRVVFAREGGGYPFFRQSPGVPGASSLREDAQKAQEGTVWEAGPTVDGNSSGEAKETQESIGLMRPSGRLEVRIPAGSNTLKPRVIVTSWSSEQQDAMFRNGTKGAGAERRTALWGGKALKGEPHERHRPSWSEGNEGRNPSRG
jgi:hypothetical protein